MRSFSMISMLCGLRRFGIESQMQARHLVDLGAHPHHRDPARSSGSAMKAMRLPRKLAELRFRQGGQVDTVEMDGAAFECARQ